MGKSKESIASEVRLVLTCVNTVFSDDDEVIKEVVFTRIELVVCLLLVSVEDLNERGGEVPVVDLVDGLDGIVVEASHTHRTFHRFPCPLSEEKSSSS